MTSDDGEVILSSALAIPIVVRGSSLVASASCMVFYKFSHRTYIISSGLF